MTEGHLRFKNNYPIKPYILWYSIGLYASFGHDFADFSGITNNYFVLGLSVQT